MLVGDVVVIIIKPCDTGWVFLQYFSTIVLCMIIGLIGLIKNGKVVVKPLPREAVGSCIVSKCPCPGAVLPHKLIGRFSSCLVARG